MKYEIKILNLKTNQTFIKTYDSFYFFNKDLNKFKRSKKLEILRCGGVI